MRNKTLRGFTLVELLVVIAILGLLASIVLVSLKGSRDKARIAAGLQFESNIYHGLGAYAVGIWDFDDQTANDTSGNNNDGTITGATFTTDTPSGKGYAMSFDGTNDYIDVPDSLSLNITDVITVEAWVKTPSSWAGIGTPRIISRGQVEGLGWSLIVKDVLPAALGFIIATVDGPWGTNYVYGATDIQLNTWYHLVATRENNGILKVYLNGVLDGIDESVGVGAINYGSPVNTYVGSGAGLGAYWKGLIDNIRIYDQAMSEAQIKQLYVEGLEKHNLVSK